MFVATKNWFYNCLSLVTIKEAKFSHGSHLLGGEKAYIPAILRNFIKFKRENKLDGRIVFFSNFLDECRSYKNHTICKLGD